VTAPGPEASAVREALAEIPYPGYSRDIVSFGLVDEVDVSDRQVDVRLVLDSDRDDVPEKLRRAIRDRLRPLAGERVRIEIRSPSGSRRLPMSQSGSSGSRSSGRESDDGPGRLPTVEAVAAVGSGKGGVGKSTVAACLALAASAGGLEVGLLDADIYGPSLPELLGVENATEQAELTEDRKILPIEARGLPFVSFGFFLGEKSPAVWRGPLVAKAVEQVSRGVVWPELDLLIVDLPPGTGDTPLSLTGTIQVDAGVVVTTPQDLAVTEARKAVEMFGALDVPVGGVIENMSYASCECGRRTYPFGQGGGARLAEEADIPLLTRVPFVPSRDRPVPGGEVAAPPSELPEEAGSAFRTAAARLAERLSKRSADGDPGAAAGGDAPDGHA